ncbi:MAG: LysM peptidoglycan-binding domain-containing protein [Lunatimonas sp.]|uniref:LysM peptidoglycan-binding domain-containing protein n=1 Tax=Lunatimonas sp. TaxID=2060141 RepID=UPI00263A4959|nr:LysM peptidoglycan-binding domain-containing protein [Lunatimonas sp.]MCC5939052.1 LysM peptidoglycan-binding domain-containing protein [Lunatimonas sp.]
MKRYLVVTVFWILSVSSWAGERVLLDSIGVEKIGEKTFIVHQVAPQETIFGISRRYNTPVSEIVQNNEALKDGLKIGQRILVPYIQKEEIPEGAILYSVQPGETLFAISRKHQVGVQQIQEWNNLQGTDLSVGQSLIIKNVALPEPKPVQQIQETVAVVDQKVAVAESTGRERSRAEPKPKPEAAEKASSTVERATGGSERSATAATSTPAPSLATSSIGGWKSHTVAQGETLFSIAQTYQAKVEDLITWNALSSNNLSIGQTLKVGRETGASIPVTRYPTPESSESNATTSAAAASVRPTETAVPTTNNTDSSTAYKNIKETGQAEVIEGTGNHKKYLVLHRDAPVGTIMRIRNEENDVTIFARVVGTLPNTGDNSRLIVKVSKAAFDQLRAVNPRFPVEISY